MLLSIVILIPLLGAWLPTALSRALGVDPARTAAALAATSLALILSQAPDVLAGATLVSGWSWIPTQQDSTPRSGWTASGCCLPC